ncbi:MAG: adenylosuccinate synthase, partial [Chitinivibrionales bacterium]|nr:adenylosuccinate synthase [Chitinivibrionales bacterium]
MANVIVVGTQWGDEGKAKVIDYLTERSDIIIRFQGGANAGHTVIAGGEKFIFHMVPSGIMYPGKTCIVGNGVVFDAEQFLCEVDELSDKNIDSDGRLFVSDKAHMVLPYHKLEDRASEALKEGGKIGTTCRGIGPAYADKAHRNGIRTGDLNDWDSFTRLLKENFEHKKKFFAAFYTTPFDLKLEETIEKYRLIRKRLLPFLADTTEYIFSATKQNKRLLFEGAQGTFLDIDHGTYPFVTSSNTIAGSACTGAGIGPPCIDHIIGIVKAYTTRVGNGPFPAELSDETGEQIRQNGGEFGATTGRPRRCGWFDSVMVRKAIQLNGITRLALTKLDVLDKLDEINICTHYEIDGRTTAVFPSDLQTLKKAKPVYETMPGWKETTAECKTLDNLPDRTIKYITRLRELCYDTP